MTVQVKTALLGLFAGVLLGLVGSLLAAAPLLVLLLRLFLGAIGGAVLFSVVYFLIMKFFPELLDSESDFESTGTNVNLVDDEEASPYVADQAQGLRDLKNRKNQARSEQETVSESDLFESDEESEYASDSLRAEPGLVHEVHEQSSGMSGASSPVFDEEAFYAGVDQLPDIGGFSNQFSGSTATAETGTLDDAAPPVVKKSGGAGGSGAAGSGINPQLMAQAIRTALKKDHL